MIDVLTMAVAVKQAGKVTATKIATAVNAYLDEHPEATTTVQDGSITTAKLASDALATSSEVDEIVSTIEGD